MSDRPAPDVSAHAPVPGDAARRARPGLALHGLARTRRTAALYGADHPVTATAADDAFTAFAELLHAHQSVRVFLLDDTFYFGRTLLLEESLRLTDLLADLADRGVGVLEFHAGLGARELQRLAEALAMPPAEVRHAGGMRAVLEQRGVRHIAVFDPPTVTPEQRAEFQVDPRDVYRAGLRAADDLYDQARRGAAIDTRKATTVVVSLLDILLEDRAPLLARVSGRQHDAATAHHPVNVAVLAMLVGMEIGLPRPLLIALGLAGLLHDIGMVRLPTDETTGTDGLTDERRAHLRRHPFYGAHLLRALPGLSRLAMVVAFEHHANFNLSGYPEIRSRPAPHMLTRVVAVADFFDTVTAAPPPDQPRMHPSAAMAFIERGAGTLFDPRVARAFVRGLGPFEPYSASA